MPDIVNPEVIEELLSLSEDGDPELLVDLIGMFLEDAPQKLDAIEKALTTRDYDGVERAAHSLKGSAGNLGASLVQADCETLQNAGRLREQTVVEATLPELRSHVHEATTALENIRARYTA